MGDRPFIPPILAFCLFPPLEVSLTRNSRAWYTYHEGSLFSGKTPPPPVCAPCDVCASLHGTNIAGGANWRHKLTPRVCFDTKERKGTHCVMGRCAQKRTSFRFRFDWPWSRFLFLAFGYVGCEPLVIIFRAHSSCFFRHFCYWVVGGGGEGKKASYMSTRVYLFVCQAEPGKGKGGEEVRGRR